MEGDFRRDVTYKKEKADRFKTEVPTFADDQQLSKLLEEKNVTVNAKPPGDRSLIETLLISFGPTLLLVALFVFLARRAAAGGAGGMLGGFGRSRARLVEASEQTVTFEDVAGIDEAEDELVEMVDFLRNPDKYSKLGARIPRGVLLAGPPGTGKTLLARAVAGEAGVPFFSDSASEFIEAIVGVGASRVRDLFEQAKQAAPAIMFIDELDAIGRSRGGSGAIGSHDEREQTLNQILTEMDGFDAPPGGDRARRHQPARDPRPGPAAAGPLRPPGGGAAAGQRGPAEDPRGAHPLGAARRRRRSRRPSRSGTPGMVGADLATWSTRRRCWRRIGTVTIGRPRPTSPTRWRRSCSGAERKIMLSEEDRERVAYHEGGHAIVGMLTAGADPVRKVSIIPRGMALGVTLSTPGGRLVQLRRGPAGQDQGVAGRPRGGGAGVQDITTGAESDIQQVTRDRAEWSGAGG